MTIKAYLLAAALASAVLPTASAAQGLFGGLGLGIQSRGGAQAEGWRPAEQTEARERVRGGDILPLPRVLGEIRRRTPGRLLDAGLETGPNGQPAYRIRWAAEDGRRIDYLVDARSGAVIRADGE